jgi:hypothetical protein
MQKSGMLYCRNSGFQFTSSFPALDAFLLARGVALYENYMRRAVVRLRAHLELSLTALK